MANRLTRITTRTGDDGTTGLGDGSRTAKTSARVHALGDVDELNSVLGLLLAEALPESASTLLTGIQHDLFDLGAELSMPGKACLNDARVAALEAEQTRYNDTLTPLREFILPGGSRAAAACHLARTVCRRAERSVVHLGEDEPVTDTARRYLNRLSDLLFVLARILNVHAGCGDVYWRAGPRV